MEKVKKVTLVLLTAIAGILLTLNGVSLIQLSQSLTLYSGIILLLVSILMYIF